MAARKSWESASAPVEGYIVIPGEGGAHPYFSVQPRVDQSRRTCSPFTE